MNKVKEEFSIHSNEYAKHNIIQQIVAKSLVRELDFEPKTIFELGCGSGQIFNHIISKYKPTFYCGVDFSQSMCDIHPKSDFLKLHCFDFDSEEFFKTFNGQKFDLIISSSAMQWSKDLNKLVRFLKTLSSNFSFALFTSNTFKTIFEITKLKSPILSKELIYDVFTKEFDDVIIETLKYKLEFETKKELFDYIKKSGVSGGVEKLNFKEAKKLYLEYPYSYLEFEVLFVKSFSKS